MTRLTTAQPLLRLLGPIAFVGVVFSLLFIGSRLHSQSIYFQDETDHVAMGWMMVEFDKSLYTDLSTNHQPIPVLFGAVLSSVIEYQTLFDLIEQIRFSMFVFSLVTSVLLTIRFGWRGAVASTLTYSLAYLYFGWYVLAESLSVPAVLFMTLYLAEVYFRDTKPTSKVSLTDSVIFGSAAFWAVFSLLPLIPFVIVSTILVLMRVSNAQRLAVVMTGLVCVAVLASVVSPKAWYEETVANNSRYVLIDQKPFTLTRLAALVLYPFSGFAHLDNNLARGILFPPLLAIIAAIALRLQKHISNTQLIIGALLAVVIGLANMRVTSFPVAFYGGFHLYPYLAALFAYSAFWIVRAAQHVRPSVFIVPLIAILLGSTLWSNMQWVFEEKNKMDEYYIQYGMQESHARLMRLIAAENDTFFSGPNGHGYINMMSGLPIAGRQLFHLEWAYRSPKLRQEFHELMEMNPPTFIYLTEDTSGYHTDLMETYLPQFYYPMRHNDSRSQLYILKTKADSLTEAQHSEMTDFQYQIIQDF